MDIDGFVEVAHLQVDPDAVLVYAEGWQSWSPTSLYRWRDPQPRPVDARQEALGYRVGRPPPTSGWQAEGLLAVQPAVGAAVVVISAESPVEVPSVRAVPDGNTLRVLADGPVVVDAAESPEGIEGALRRWGTGFRQRFAAPADIPPAPTVWCTWYRYYLQVTADHVRANLDHMSELALPIDVVQIDDGYQRGLGDWLDFDPGFGDLPRLVADIRGAGRRAGIWLAPFLVGDESRLAEEHPEWLRHDVSAGSNWNQNLRVLDVAQPAAADYLSRVVGELSGLGIDYFKLDFLYAGALPGAGRSDSAALESYREGLRLVREAAGPDAFIVGCGAPTVASVGLVDAMRISPDIATHVDPAGGDLSAPALRSALFSGKGRAWQNRTLWWADPDCLIARSEMPEREAWAAWVTSVAGLRSISDDLGELDEAGLALIRGYLSDL